MKTQMLKSRPCRLATRTGAWLGGIALSLAAVAGAAFTIIEYDGNLHVVTPGVFYRSAQLTAPDFHRVIAADGIKTILNLRGDNTGTPWYDDEIAAARRDGVKHIDFAMSANQSLTEAQMRTVIQLIDNAPKPILVHCKSGSDRTGLVSALYRLSRGELASEAKKELALRYGHFPYLGSRTIAMDKSLDTYIQTDSLH
jgi:uncharacterized protein (TIGR01244 family)